MCLMPFNHFECSKVGNHPNIVRLVGVCLDEAQTSIVSQFYAQGSCYKVFLRDRRNVPWKDLLKVVKGAAAGILHLHAENYIHRDIASRNILISDSFEGIVTDFGMSRLQLRDGSQSITYLGPVKWMAPESIRDKIISKATDVYMFGSFMWELIMRDIPYADEDPFAAALKVINQGCSLAMPEDCHPGYLSIMEACLRTAPEERPDFVEIFTRLEELFDEAESNPSLTYAKPATTGLIVAQKSMPKSVYVDSSPIFELGTVQLESSPSPFKPESKLNKSISSSGSSSISSVGYMDAMPVGTGYMDAMPRSESPLAAPYARSSLGVPTPRKSAPVNHDGYLSVMPTIAINANGYIFTTSEISSAGSSSSRDTGTISPKSNSSPNDSRDTIRDDASIKSNATSAPRSIPSPGRPKMSPGGSVSPSNASTPLGFKFQPGSLDSSTGSPYSSSLPSTAPAPAAVNTTVPSNSNRAHSLKISTSSSPSPTATNTPPLSPTTGPSNRRMSASSSSSGNPMSTSTGLRSGSHGIPVPGNSASSAPTLSKRPKEGNGTVSPSSSSPSVHATQNTRFGNTSDTPLRGNITLYSTRVIPSSELMGWQPQFHLEHVFKRSRMSSSAPSRGSPVHMMGNNNMSASGPYPPPEKNGNNGNHNMVPQQPSSPYGPPHGGHNGLSVSMGAPGASPYALRSPQQAPTSHSHPHLGGPYQQPSSAGGPPGPGRSLNQSAGTYHGPHGHASGSYAPQTQNVPSPHMQQQYKPSGTPNQPQNPFSMGGGMLYQPPQMHGMAPNYGVPSPYQHPGHSPGSQQQPQQPQQQPSGYAPQQAKSGLQLSGKSISPTSPQSPQVLTHQQQPQQQPSNNGGAPLQQHPQQQHTYQQQPQAVSSPYATQPYPLYTAPYAPVTPQQYYPPSYAAPSHQQPPSSVTSSTYTKPLPHLPSAVTSSTYVKPLPAIPETNPRKSYGPSGY